MAEQLIASDINTGATSKPVAETASTVAGTTNKGRIAQRIFRSSANDTLPLTIRHERIYILPSRRGIAFMCVIAIMLMASINYGLNLGYALCFILIGLFASCLLATYKNLVQIRFVSINARESFEGSDLSYRIRIGDDAHRQRFSIDLDTDNANTTFDLRAQEAAEVALTVKDASRGIHALGRLTLSSDYPLGLWRGWGYLHVPVHTYIYPKPESPCVDFAGYNNVAGGPVVNRSGEQEFAGLKTFENSDSPSRVAWKRVASGAGWYSKQFEAEDEQREVAIRWQDTPAHLSTEQRLSRLCAWVVRAKDENIAHTFELPGSKSLALASGIEHYETCLRALAVARLDDASHADQASGKGRHV